MVKNRIPRSKTDQLHKGDEVVIARSQDRTCPVRMLERYIMTAKIRMDIFISPIYQVGKRRVPEGRWCCELHNNEGAIQEES